MDYTIEYVLAHPGLVLTMPVPRPVPQLVEIKVADTFVNVDNPRPNLTALPNDRNAVDAATNSEIRRWTVPQLATSSTRIIGAGAALIVAPTATAPAVSAVVGLTTIDQFFAANPPATLPVGG